MYIDRGYSKHQVFQTIYESLSLSCKTEGHPLRFFVLSTVAKSTPRQRYVVLRNINTDFEIDCYTDYRSDKVAELQSNANASLLMYDQRQKLQIRLVGETRIHYQDLITEVAWDELDERSKYAYNTVLKPGTEIATESYDHAESFSAINFAVLRIKISELEVLQLNGNEHLRFKSVRTGDCWNHSWLVP